VSQADFIALLALSVAAYHFVGYPVAMILSASLLSRLRRTSSTAPTVDVPLPAVTLIVAAFNEERVIADKIANSLELDYPPHLLSVLIVADGSSDGTADIVRSFRNDRVACLSDPVRRGKSHALNRAVAATTSEVVVLSDANNHYSRDSLRLLVHALGQPGVGAATGLKRIVESKERAASTGDSLYWKYESLLKKAESECGGTVTGDGEILALRRSVYEPIPEAIVNDDLFLSIRLVEKRLKIVYVPEAEALEEASLTINDDFRTKVRMIAGGLQNLVWGWKAIASHPFFAVKFVSHKILRWCMPVVLATLFVSTLFSGPESPMRLLLWGQVAFYGLGILGAALNSFGIRSFIVNVPFYFLVMNAAATVGLLRFFRGGQTTLWTKATR